MTHPTVQFKLAVGSRRLLAVVAPQLRRDGPTAFRAAIATPVPQLRTLRLSSVHWREGVASIFTVPPPRSY
jgi:hypothetical protein